MKNLKKAVTYYRTSSAANVGEDKDSEKRQKHACHTYAKKAGLSVLAEFYDANVKGKDSIGSRAGFSTLLEYCQDNEVEIIIFENAGRFSRDQVVQELGYRELKEQGFTLICADAPEYFTDDTDNPSIKMIRQILGSVAEFQKDELVLKLRGARKRKRKTNRDKGILTLSGKGKVEGRRSLAETDPELVRIVKRLFRKNPKTGKRRSLRTISQELFSMGYGTKDGNPFSAGQIKRMVNARKTV